MPCERILPATTSRTLRRSRACHVAACLPRCTWRRSVGTCQTLCLSLHLPQEAVLHATRYSASGASGSRSDAVWLIDGRSFWCRSCHYCGRWGRGGATSDDRSRPNQVVKPIRILAPQPHTHCLTLQRFLPRCSRPFAVLFIQAIPPLMERDESDTLSNEEMAPCEWSSKVAQE